MISVTVHSEACRDGSLAAFIPEGGSMAIGQFRCTIPPGAPTQRDTRSPWARS